MQFFRENIQGSNEYFSNRVRESFRTLKKSIEPLIKATEHIRRSVLLLRQYLKQSRLYMRVYS